MKYAKVSIEYVAAQQYAATSLMKEIVQSAIEQAERDGYTVKWVGDGEMVLTQRGGICETTN